ncbi:MAG: serine hydrolase domain-containing protein, partial [Chromatiaceae bacterium]
MPLAYPRRTALAAASAAFLLLAQSWALSGPPEAASPSPARLGSANAASLWVQAIGPFLDQVLADQLALLGIPGAAIAVVHGEEILHLAGYGKADLGGGQPVSPEDTLFRVGSVAKLLTWTAVMQLVEQGRLDPHGDVDRYLDRFQIPATFPESVTLAHLLTHTAGFEERGFGPYARSARDLVPLGAFLAAQRPARIFPPGEVSAYSNYGAALAGYLVERVSETPFEDYVEAHVLAPLGMTSSRFRQPLPPSLAAHLATGYRLSLAPGAFEWDLEGPAGALSSTAADMARFMIAHLQKDRLGGVRILREETAEAMQRRQFANHPAVSGLTYGFQELNLTGQHVLVQPGDMLYFTAALFLLPEQNLALFVAYNRGRASEAPTELLRALLARLDPLAPWFLPAPPASSSDRDLGRFAGTYRSTRRNESTLEKLQELFSPVRVRAVAPGTLWVSGLAVVPRALWVQTEPGVFRDQASPQL